jgi:hypothetical protein
VVRPLALPLAIVRETEDPTAALPPAPPDLMRLETDRARMAFDQAEAIRGSDRPRVAAAWFEAAKELYPVLQDNSAELLGADGKLQHLVEARRPLPFEHELRRLVVEDFWASHSP